jgi:hypothetical protein
VLARLCRAAMAGGGVWRPGMPAAVSPPAARDLGLGNRGVGVWRKMKGARWAWWARNLSWAK